MTGWCPIHDRVYEADDGLCPRCGTALVTEDAPTHDPIVIEPRTGYEEGAPPPSRKTSTVAGIAGAVVVAFVGGLAFPQVGKPGPTRPQVFEAKSDLTVGFARTDVGVTIRLESFSQKGRSIVARFTVPSSEELAIGRLRTVGIEFSGLGGVLGADVMSVRQTTNGFVVEGAPIPPDRLVSHVRLTGLNFAFHGEDEVPLTFTGVWPAMKGNEPRAGAAAGTIETGDGLTLRLTGIVGWHDQLEVAMVVEGAPGVRPNGYQYFLDVGFPLAGAAQESYPGRVSVFFPFTDVSTSLRKARLSVTVDGIEIEGDWTWKLTPRG